MYVDKTSTLQGLLRFYIDRNQSILINEQNLHEMICCYVVLIYVCTYCVCTEGALRGHSTTTWTQFYQILTPPLECKVDLVIHKVTWADAWVEITTQESANATLRCTRMTLLEWTKTDISHPIYPLSRDPSCLFYHPYPPFLST